MEIVPRARTRDAGSLAIASWEAAPEKYTRNSVAPERACDGWPNVVARMSPASPANRPLAAKAARVPAAAGTGKLAGVNPSAASSSPIAESSVPVSGTTRRPRRPTAPRARKTR